MMRIVRIILILFLLVGVVSAAEDKVTLNGKVQGVDGSPISEAEVSILPLEISVNSDANGEFILEIPSGTYTIIVEAPGYEVRGESLSVSDPILTMNFVLQPKHLQFEEIVIASEEISGSSPSSPTSSVQPDRQSAPTSVLESVKDIPGVAPLGQGGLFQVPSIRGAARERTILMMESVRITSERRTGPSFSFVDSHLIERIDVTRGPAPVLYGSNGETGLIQAFALEPDSTDANTSFRAGYQSNSNEHWQSLIHKNGSDKFQYALGAVRREGGDFESGDGQEFLSGFTRVNLLAKGRWFTESGTLTFLVLPSWTDDIEKASSDAVTRPTLYPEERHQIYLADWQSPFLKNTYDFQVQGWYHPNSLITQDDRVEDGLITSRAIVLNETDDYGARFRIGREVFADWRFWTGLDVFGRTDINAHQDNFEASTSGSGFDLVNAFDSIQNGSYLDTGLFLTGNGKIGKMLTATGVRFQRVRTSNNAGVEVSSSEYSWSGNVGGSIPMSSRWEIIWNLGRGIRPATIGEKFFTGETGRGSVAGNPDLQTESNFEVDGGLRFHHSKGQAAFYVFRNHINDFIARVRIEDESFTFRNFDEVTIYGVEGEAYYQWSPFQVYGNFHWIQGEDAGNIDINDIPPSRAILGVQYRPNRGAWNASVEYVHQFEKGDPGPDELLRESANVLNATLDYEFHRNLRLRIFASNLFDEAYFDSADNRAPLAIGRSIGLEILTQF
jgi:outer membrane receptor protein involved in Fe transport